MNYKMLSRFLALILAVEAFFMLPALGISYFDGTDVTTRAFGISIAVILVVAAVLVLIEKGVMGSVPAFIVIARELIVTSLRIVAMGEGIVIAAQKSGKLKTFMQIAGIIFLFTPLREISLVYCTAGDIAVWLIAAITLISGIEYFKSFGGVLNPSAEPAKNTEGK